uniref:Putative lipocalin n=1 Tax=Ixodes ricinus TaxID=34613 RepID=A0A6B0V000_IXORI
MCKPRETMIALFFLRILFLCLSHATLSQSREEGYPDAIKVMQNLPKTYMLKSLGEYPKVLCGFQYFYNRTLRSENYRMYNLYFFRKDRIFHDQAFYVKKVSGNTIFMGTHYEKFLTPTDKREILFSKTDTCMVIRDPKNSKACNLMVTKESSSNTPKICLEKFQKYCEGTAFNYSVTDCPYPAALPRI